MFKGGVFLLVLSVLRIGLNHLETHPSPLPEGGSELPELLAESRETRDEEALRSAPLAPGETLDPNRAGEVDFDRLPGIGPSTAAVLVADRDENGGFAEADDLLRVPGIGPTKLERIRRYLDFSDSMPLEAYRSTRLLPKPEVELEVDPNRASWEELQSLKGIGPELAERIIESRRKEGPFRSARDLLRVRGIGPVLLSRIRDRLTLGG